MEPSKSRWFASRGSNKNTDAASTTVNYADWRGTKHLSAIKASVREEVVAAITHSSIYKHAKQKTYETPQAISNMEKLRSLYRWIAGKRTFECPNCGEEVDPRYEECENCGRQLL
jgi:predicted RNA-binding Zn-ribbon protein involved in translation (DUF1610 family)